MTQYKAIVRELWKQPTFRTLVFWTVTGLIALLIALASLAYVL